MFPWKLFKGPGNRINKMSKVSTKEKGTDEYTLVVVGSGGVGKSCLTIRFLKDEFSNDYDPTIEENYRKRVVADGSPCIVNIVDTAGQHEYTALRDQHLTTGDGFLLVFALNEKSTLSEIMTLRQSIINLKDTSKVPFVLVGNKCDIPQKDVTQKDIDDLLDGSKIPYMETSAKDNINVEKAYQELIKETRRLLQTKKSKACALL